MTTARTSDAAAAAALTRPTESYSHMTFQDLFGARKPLIAVLHLLPLPGAPLYDGDIQKVYDQALSELDVFKRHMVDSVIVENFRDMPYYPGRVPAETVASLAAVSREIVRVAGMP